MKYALKACTAIGIVVLSWCVPVGGQALRTMRPHPPMPSDFAALGGDEEILPVAHFATASDDQLGIVPSPVAVPEPMLGYRGAMAQRGYAGPPATVAIPSRTSGTRIMAGPRPMVVTPGGRTGLATPAQRGVTMELSDSGAEALGGIRGGSYSVSTDSGSGILPGPIPVTSGDLLTSGCASDGCAGIPATGACADGSCAEAWPGAGCCELPPCPGDCGGSCLTCCASPVWRHRSGFFGEYLNLRPRDAEIVYAAPIDGPINGPPANNPIQVGALGMVDPDYESGYRAGFQLALSDCSSFVAGYTRFDSSTRSQITTEPGLVLRSLVAHPSSSSAATDWLDAAAQYDVDFQFVDAAYRALIRGGDRYAINYLVGARYAQLNQSFASIFAANGTENVNSTIQFEGGGIRLGLDGERYSCGRRFFLYGSGAASFLAGRFDANYFQGQSFDPSVADTRWDAGRVVTVLDVEAGLGWASQTGRFRVSSGYVISAWLNAVQANHFIDAVQQNRYLDLADTFTFDGLVVRGEFRF